MTPFLRQEYRRIALTLMTCLLLAILTNSLWPVLLALLAWILYFLTKLTRLAHWTKNYDGKTPPPEASGSWGELFDRIYHILRREAQQRAALEQLIDRAEQSVTALRDAVVVVDRTGRIDFWNESAQRLLGLQAPHDKRQTLTNLLRDPRFSNYLHRGNFQQTLVLPSPNNENLQLEFTLTRFGTGDILIIVRDVTRLHNLEQMRKDFVANVSHELKTPLTVLKGYLETLADMVPDDKVRLHRALQQMSQQSDRMALLVNDLLLLARLESTETTNTGSQVPMASMLRQLVQDATTFAPEKAHRIDMHIDSDADLLGDATELQSAFSNLLTNAVKYTPPGGMIELRWWHDRNGGHLAVKDNGIGIEARHIPRLTERFYRPDDSRVTSTGGTGLGLAIVKHVMLRHDGLLQIESAPGKGSTFICHFPPRRLCQTSPNAAPACGVLDEQ